MDGSKTGEAARPGSRALFINYYPVISAAPGNSFPVQVFKKGNGMLPGDLEKILESRNLEWVAGRESVRHGGDYVSYLLRGYQEILGDLQQLP